MTATHNSSTEPAAAGASTKENPRFALCDRLSRTRDNSQRQLPTDQDYAVSTREYQTDQSSLKLPRLLLALSSKTANKTTPTNPRIAQVDTVTPYQGLARFQVLRLWKCALAIWHKSRSVLSEQPSRQAAQRNQAGKNAIHAEQSWNNALAPKPLRCGLEALGSHRSIQARC